MATMYNGVSLVGTIRISEAVTEEKIWLVIRTIILTELYVRIMVQFVVEAYSTSDI